jgi:uncharacterized protein YqgC (DUF456 family)
MQETLNYVLLFIIQFFMLVGLIGLVVPIFPGILIMWLAALGYGIAAGFNTLGIVLFAFISLLALVGSLADNLFMGAGARRGGASWLSIFVALSVGIIGTILFPPIGGLIAAPLAVLALEYYRLRDWTLARQAVFGMAKGWGLSLAARLVIGLMMMGLWWVWVWKG